MSSGNGWVLDCPCGRRHWGLFGAAGLLVTHGSLVLLQQRALWTHEGGTWSIPGGARDQDESAVRAAHREASEETSLNRAVLTEYAQWVEAHGTRWSYTTILAHAPEPDDVRSTNPESDAMRWWPVDEVPELRLHPGFAATWPKLRVRILEVPPAATGGSDRAGNLP